MRVLILFLIWPFAVAAQLAEAPLIPQLRVMVTPATALETHGYVQGQLILRIQLISRHPFEALSLVLPQIENADVMQLARPRTREISGYAGRGHVHERVLAVIPRRAGRLIIPPVTAAGAVEPVKDEELAFDLASAPFEIDIDGPHARYDADWWLAAERAEMDESWSEPIEEIRVTEPVQRKVSLRVWGVRAEHLPKLTHPPAQGAAISLRSAETRTEVSSEGLIAFADYVWDIEIDRQQVVFLKPIAVTYWDTIAHGQKSASAPAHRIEPLPADPSALADNLMAEAAGKRADMSTLALISALALAAPLLAVLATALYAALPTREDLRLWRACGPGADPGEMYTALDRWRVASGLAPGAAARKLPARAALSDQLFGRAPGEFGLERALRRQALTWSRSVRLARLAAIIRPTA